MSHTTEERCSESVYGDYHRHQCLNKGRLEHEGRKYCKTHHPPNVEAKKKQRDAKYAKEHAIEDARFERIEFKDYWFPKLALAAVQFQNEKTVAEAVRTFGEFTSAVKEKGYWGDLIGEENE